MFENNDAEEVKEVSNCEFCDAWVLNITAVMHEPDCPTWDRN